MSDIEFTGDYDDEIELGNWELPSWIQMNFINVAKAYIIAGDTPGSAATLYVWRKS